MSAIAALVISAVAVFATAIIGTLFQDAIMLRHIKKRSSLDLLRYLHVKYLTQNDTSILAQVNNLDLHLSDVDDDDLKLFLGYCRHYCRCQKGGKPGKLMQLK